MSVKTLSVSTLELHYDFFDKQHRIDAFVQNNCEKALLTLMKEVSSYFDIPYIIETELTKEGGIRKYFNFIPDTKNSKNEIQKSNLDIRTQLIVAIIASLMLSPVSAGLTGVVNNAINRVFADKELEELDKDIKRETLAKLRLERQDQQEELENNRVIRKAKSDFYKELYDYSRLDSVSFTEEDLLKNEVVKHPKILRNDFDGFILTDELLDDVFVESVPVVIISPVLDNGNKKRTWKGIYNGDVVNLHIKSQDFLSSVDEGLIEFKHGFIITCNIRIECKKLQNGKESKTYIVTEVINYIIDDKLCETLEGKRYKQRKADEEAMQEFDFGDD